MPPGCTGQYSCNCFFISEQRGFQLKLKKDQNFPQVVRGLDVESSPLEEQSHQFEPTPS